MLRNEYVVIRIGERDVLFKQTMPPCDFLVNKSDLEPNVASHIKIGDVFTGIDRGSTTPFDLVPEKRHLADPKRETQSEQADFRFVPRLYAETKQAAESYIQRASSAPFAVITGKTLSAANGWLVPIRRLGKSPSQG